MNVKPNFNSFPTPSPPPVYTDLYGLGVTPSTWGGWGGSTLSFRKMEIAFNYQPYSNISTLNV